MTTVELLTTLRRNGIQLWVEGEMLHYSAPSGALTPTLRAELVQHKADLLTLLCQARDDADGKPPPLKPVSQAGELPLSYAQQRLWFLCELQAEAGAAYNISAALRLEGGLDQAALRTALRQLTGRQQSLRMNFRNVEGQPRIVLREPYDPLQVEDLCGLGGAEPEATIRRVADEHARRPFDLAHDPLLRLTVLRLSDDAAVLLFSIHHIIADAWSLGVLVRELSALYAAACAGGEADLPPLPIDYPDHAAWQRQWLSGEVLTQQLAYWRGQLAGAPSLLELPTDQPRPAAKTYGGAQLRQALEPELVGQLQRLSRRQGATLYMTLLAAFATLLARYSGQDDVVVGSPIANRTQRQVEGLIGFFVNTLVLRCRVSPNQSFSALLAEVRQTALGAYAHQDVPFEKLVDELQPERSLGHSPLFQVMFALQNTPDEALTLGGLQLQPLVQEQITAKFDLTLNLEEKGGELAGVWEYSTDLFEAATIARMAQHFAALLRGIVADPHQPVGRLSLLTETEQQQLALWNHTATDYPRQQTVAALFAEQAASTPAAVALVGAGGELNYGEVEERANRLAHYLQGCCEIAPDQVVGLCLERSPALIVGMLAILKAGAAYLPLDADYPAERLCFMIEDAGVSAIVTHSRFRARLPESGVKLICLDGDGPAIASCPPQAPASAATAESLAYVMYTSGSTGQPKGVCVPQRAVVRLVKQTNYARLTADEVFLQYAPVSFDAATFEIWGTLLNGAKLVLMPPGQRSLAELGAVIQQQGITTLWLTSSLFNLLIDEQPTALQGMRQLVIGGEALSVGHICRALEQFPACQFINGYGPTENTTFTCCYAIEKRDYPVSIPIGVPIANTTVYLLDEQQQPVPIGIPGELYTGGDGLARGYLYRPELTAERFVEVAGLGRLYRTGDRCRWRADGTIEFLGRLDEQIKLRGFRIEPGEIETLLRGQPGVKDAAVIVQGEGEHRRLIAYLLPAVPPLDIGPIRQSLDQQLPDYMVPNQFMILSEMPLTHNGKLDRSRLPAPQSDVEVRPHSPPSTPTEELLAVLWCAVLKCESVSREDNFFEVGGHSLLATQVISQIRATFHLELPLDTVFASPTLRELASEIDAHRHLEGFDTAIPRVDRAHPLPLSFAQERLWFLSQLEPENPFYNTPLALRIKGQLNKVALAGAFQDILNRHEVLRTAFVNDGGQPLQMLLERLTLTLAEEDLSDLPTAELEARLLERASVEARTPFYDLATPPLVRAVLLTLRSDEYALLLTMHHIITDGWSLSVLTRELAQFYNTRCTGTVSELEPLPIQYADFAAWQRQWLSGGILDQQLEYWRRHLSGAPPMLALPADHPRPAVQQFRGGSVRFTVDGATRHALQRIGRAHNATLFMTLLSGFAVLLHRYSGQSDIVIGSPIANRNRAEFEPLIGFFVNTLAMRVDLSGAPSFTELLARVRQMALDAYEHQDLPFERLVDEIQPERDLSLNPMFQVMFALQNAPVSALELPGLKFEMLAAKRVAALFDLVLDIWETGDTLTGVLEFNADLFDEPTIQQMAESFQTLLGEIARAPQQSVDELALIDKSAERRLLALGDGPRRVYPVGHTIHELFAQVTDECAERIAAVHNDERTTYAELNARSNQIAHWLRRHGVSRHDFVGILQDRGIDMLAAMLGVLKAGGAFLPIDPAYPVNRIRHMLEDSGVATLIGQRSTVAVALRAPWEEAREVPNAFRRLLDLDSAELTAQPTNDPPPVGGPEDVAYILYTSGSTGLPKGAMVRHNGAVNHIFAEFDLLQFHRDSKFLQSAPSSSDISVWQFLAPLLIGGRTVVADYETMCDPRRLLETIQSQRITLMELVPVVLKELLEFVRTLSESERSLPDLEWAMVTGEAAPVSLVNQWLSIWPDVPLVNAYGPTEAADDVAQHVLTQPLPTQSRNVPIGCPLPNLTLYVLDHNLQLVPLGVPGEICVSGIGVGAGYWNNEARTRESFVANPYSEGQRGDVVYRTGDLGRWLPDGSLECLDRLDQQVKVRGFRIELGEIEGVLSGHPAVRDAAVIVREDRPDDKRLVAYFLPNEDSEATRKHLRRLQKDQISLWQDLHEDSYCETLDYDEPTFNVIGWDSNYTGQPLPREDMREYVDFTVERIRALEPRRLLEIGSGTGLIMFPLLPHVESYVGTDLSAVAVRRLQLLLESPALRQRVPGLEKARLLHRRADEMEWAEPHSFDTVILPSVVQYFPGIDYLKLVLASLIDHVIEPGGAIFLGDVRNLPLLKAFHASVQLHKSDDELPVGELAQRVQSQLAREQELAIDPKFFLGLAGQLPRIQRVKILPKRGRRLNEMARFRYDVIIHLASDALQELNGQHAGVPQRDWNDWRQHKPSVADIRRKLTEEDPAVLAYQHVANARVAESLQTLQWLSNAAGAQHPRKLSTSGQLKDALKTMEIGGLEPEDIWELSTELPYDVNVSLASARDDGSFDVVLTHRSAQLPACISNGERLSAPRRKHANNPLREKLARGLASELREFLKARLPNYMVPIDIVMLDELPLTPAGKIDRKSLPPPETSSKVDDDYVAPRTTTEAIMCRIWADVLGVDRVGVGDNFFALGGHSLKATQVVSRIHRELGAGIAVRHMFSHPTIAELNETLSVQEEKAYVAIPRVAEASHYPLSHAQRRLWVLSQMEGGSVAYNMPEAILVDGEIEADVVQLAIERLVQRHESLRTTFILVDGEPRQRVQSDLPCRLQVRDLSDEENPEQLARGLADAAAHEPFDLENGPLLRASLLKLGARRFALLFNIHHIVCDDWSMGVIVREFTQLVGALRHGTSCNLPELRFQYRDYAVWQLRMLRDGTLDADREYWQRKLGDDIPLLQFPTDYPRPKVRTFRGSKWSFQLGERLTEDVQAFCRQQDVSLFMMLVATVKSLLYRYTGQRDIVIGCPIVERNDVDLENQVGLYLNTLALRDQLAGSIPFQALLRQVRQTTIEAYDHQAYPFDRLVNELQLQRQANRSPLFDNMLILQNVDPYKLTLDGTQIRPLEQQNHTVQFDLCFYCQEVNGSLRVDLRYSTDLFHLATIVGMSQRFRALVESVVRAPATPLDELPLDLPVPREVLAPKPLASELSAEARPTRLPLSYHEERLWFIDRFETGNVYESNPIYHNLPWLVHLRGALDAQALEESLSQMLQRHTALRTHFVVEGGEPCQVVLPEAHLHLEVLREASHLDEAIERAVEYASEPFNLDGDVLVRAAMIPFAPEECLLVLAVHHIVADRASLQILGQELAEIYAERQSGRIAPLATPNAQYADYVQWQRSLGHDAWEPLLFHWRWQLRGKLQVLELPEDRPRPAVHTYTAATYKFALDADLAQRVEADQDACSVLLTGFNILLHRYARQDEIVVGTIMPCRGPHQSDMVGPLDNLTVLRSFLGGNPTSRSVLSQIQQTVRAAYQYRHLPFDLLVQKLNPEKDMSRTALFDVLFQYEPDPLGELPMGAVRARVLETNLGLGKYDLNLLIQRTETGMFGTLVYNADIFDASTVERMMGHYRTLLESVTRDWEIRINDLEVLSDAELHEQLVTWNSTEATYPSSKTIHELFEGQVRQHPNRTALVCNDTRLTYSELNGRANQLAHALRQQGVSPDTLVALCLDRSPEMVVALLAVLKAGGAYLPIEPSLPAARMQFIVEDAGVAHLVTTRKHAAHLPAGLPVPMLLDEVASCGSWPTTNPDAWASPQNMAYTIYTSGSTGKPKGALIEHRNVVRLMVNDRLPFEFTCDDAWTMFHSYSFDFSVWEMYGALLYGGKLVIVPREVTNDPARYLDLLEREEITVLNQTPSAFYALVQEACAGEPRGLAMRYVIFGGEALQPAQLNRWCDAYPRTRLVNMYGITETTVHVTFKELTRADIAQNVTSVGTPIPTTTLYVMDSDLRLLPVGVPGEICVGGLGVSRGYLNRDELTGAKFMSNPYRPDERLYRSGDLGKLLPNGELAYLGRIDNQVQIRGFRVELGEVESVLLEHPAVRETVAVAHQEHQSTRLIAYWVPRPGSEPFPDAGELRGYMKTRLPEYMVPATLLRLERLPLNANSKIDLGALPSPNQARMDAEASYVAPRTHSERTVATIWRKVLQVGRVGAHDNFFDLGGDSLLLIRVKNLIREELGVDLPVVELFRYPTVDSLSRLIGEDQVRGDGLQQSEQRAVKRNAANQRNRAKRRG